MVYCAGKLIQNWNIFRFTQSYFIIAIDFTFYGITGVITHAGCWENTRKACKSLAEDGNDVTCHAWFSEKLRRKPEINVIVKKRSTTIFHTLHSCRPKEWRHKMFKALLWNHSAVARGSTWILNIFRRHCYSLYSHRLHLFLVSCEVSRKITRDMLRYFHLRRVIYKLFSCSPNVPCWLSRR